MLPSCRHARLVAGRRQRRRRNLRCGIEIRGSAVIRRRDDVVGQTITKTTYLHLHLHLHQHLHLHLHLQEKVRRRSVNKVFIKINSPFQYGTTKKNLWRAGVAQVSSINMTISLAMQSLNTLPLG